MIATILSETTLLDLPSASGVEIVGPAAYLLSDDAPYLYLLDAATLAPVDQVELFVSTEFGTGRIPKARKPDLECMAAVVAPGGQAGLLLCGSGAQANRETGYFVGLVSPGASPEGGRPRFVQRLDLAGLYARLRTHLPIGTTLNLEAAATTPTELLLLQRPVGAGPALVFELPLAATLAHLFEPRLPVPPPGRVLRFALPTLGGYAAGFSGATFVDGRLLITASVEATTDALADGATLGSFVGLLDLAAQTASFARLTWGDGRAYLGKVEGLAVRRTQGPDQLELLLVSDDDRGGSTALVAEVQLKR
ncbi:hypothetical protein CDA63_15230 [Hymenobacter amundsenii]|uniref:Phytase-like domain-containing protein n=1 Tax=Hymenobacter amundsenii TaxID=2006685 RepID=A0A246FI96_9BACT|nr:hypothetical protein [Hymenobacter amundsenii]OWP62253.1 hypothetical protein CDA63_15230 [Hymenobacter amundsenii]